MKKKLFILFLLVLLFLLSLIDYTEKPISQDLINIEIKGEVNQEEVLSIPYGYRLNDVLKLIKLNENADLSQLSLNDTLSNNQVIVIPKKSETKLISINSSSLEELTTIPGIGKVTAQRIIDYRINNSFKSLEDLKNVKGIGDKTFEKIKEYICL